jgi:hypothetical protein
MMGMDYDEDFNVGKAILLRAGVLTECLAGHMVYRADEDPTPAYKLASALVRDGDPLVKGMTRERVLDGVKAAFDDHSSDECTHPAHDLDT